MRWKHVIGFGLLLCAGCSGSDTLPILMRDANALLSETADSLMWVTDDSSAKSFLDSYAPRYKKRNMDLGKRFEMWVKYADDEMKKLKKEFDDIHGKRFEKGAADPPAGAFDKLSSAALLERLSNEFFQHFKRLGNEQDRMSKVLRKLAEQKAFEMQEDWRASGIVRAPVIGRGGDVDPEKEWPHLYKLQADTAREALGESLGPKR